MVVSWRAGLRIQEALVLPEHDLDSRRGCIFVRNGNRGAEGRLMASVPLAAAERR